MFNSNIKQIVILMVDRDLIFKEFIIQENEFKYFTEKWKKRLILFDKKLFKQIIWSLSERSGEKFNTIETNNKTKINLLNLIKFTLENMGSYHSQTDDP